MSLRNALSKVLARGQSQAKFSRMARVSTRFVNQIITGREFDPIADDDPKWAQKAPVRAAAVARVASAADYDVDKALREMNLPPKHPLIEAAVKRARQDAERPRRVADLVFDRISTDKKVNVGVLDWWPLSNGQGEATRFTKEFVSRLVSTLNPQWSIAYSYFDSIADALREVTAGDRVDMVMGLFDTPGRRSQQMLFCPIGGLQAQLSAIYVYGSGGKVPDWKEIVSFSPKGRWRLVALEEEAGHRYFRGPCGFSGDEVLAVDRLLPPEIATAVAKSATSSEPAIFLTEHALCEKVRLELEHRGVSVQSIPVVPKVAYSMGIGLRADAEFFAFLLNHVQVDEFFRNAPIQMGRVIGDLLSETRGYLSWSWDRVWDHGKAAYWEEFVNAAPKDAEIEPPSLPYPFTEQAALHRIGDDQMRFDRG